MQLLRHVAAHHAQGVALSELVMATGLDRTTGLYRLGIEAVALGFTAMERAPLIERCLPAMKALARRTEEHVFLVAHHGQGVADVTGAGGVLVGMLRGEIGRLAQTGLSGRCA